MGCHVLELADGRAVLHCSCSEVVFGNIFDDVDDAEAFVAHTIRTTGRDPRAMTDAQLGDAIAQWKQRSRAMRRLGLVRTADGWE